MLRFLVKILNKIKVIKKLCRYIDCGQSFEMIQNFVLEVGRVKPNKNVCFGGTPCWITAETCFRVFLKYVGWVSQNLRILKRKITQLINHLKQGF